MAVQDKVVRTKNYEKNVLNMNVLDRCRKCSNPGETIEHITGGCPALANNAYLNRHNQAAKILHLQLALKYKLITERTPYYKYSPSPVLESRETLLYWDRPIITDKTIDHNRPDILLIDKTNKRALIVEVGIPLSHNLIRTEQEKAAKYKNLEFELKRLWHLKEIKTVPIIMSVEGLCTKQLRPNIESLGLPNGLAILIQKAVVLQTCYLVRQFLSI